MVDISIIIPCYRDSDNLLRLLIRLRQLTEQPMQIIVVDAEDSRCCAEICRQFQAVHLKSEPNRGQQLLEGAAHAQGDVLWFLHADAQLADDALIAITTAIADGAVGGYFRFHFAEPRAWPAWILEQAIAVRCRFGVSYGDQGIFITRAAYRQSGGHAPWPLFEEVPLVYAVRRLGAFVPLATPIFVDSRRWQRDGWWQRTWKNRMLALRFICGASPQQLARRYRSKNRV